MRLALAVLIAVLLPATSAAAAKKFYLSVGDSYAVGYQPDADTGGPGGSTTDGFADQLVRLAKPKLKLRNFGCGGATTSSLLEQQGCPKKARALKHAVKYSGSQADAVVRFLKLHRKQTGLVTVSIGGNDVTKCRSEADPITCVTDAADGINTNLKQLLKRFRRAAGKKVRIVGLTYPDVILGLWVTGEEADRNLAKLSQVAFEKLINPALKKQYEAVGGTFVDVTKATGGYDSLEGETTTRPGYAPYDILPLPVAQICDLTWFCQYQDIHAKASGYRVIAKLIAKVL